jgi:serine/threonine-protein kinase
MEQFTRYELVDTIGSGDFATVYRARDRELGREVAIKQVHQQFLTDQRQLARYWQEAQLLASLQHPNIVTIYDIARSRGWLILELMRGSLKPMAQGEPIDLDYLRVVLVGCLNALHFLHQNGVIHGDIKPSNILVDSMNRVKISDFGLARRASNEEGSLLKGTTKYMAPELINPQFGPVGPASDIYSLGFSAYELMCGGQFESLFPGLGSFGRDRQIAWMMWHAAGDRNLPEIGKVLEGVPPDLAHVVQKMVAKDPARRYNSALDVLRDLQPDPRLTEPLPEQLDLVAEEERIAVLKRKRRMRYVAILAVAFSGMMCASLFLPQKPKVAPAGPPAPLHGVVHDVVADSVRPYIKIAASDAEGKDTFKDIRLSQNDKIFINDVFSAPGELRPHDTVEIVAFGSVVADNWKLDHHEIHASRPKMDKGHVQDITPDGALVLAIDEGEGQGKQLKVFVPGDLRIVFNGQQTLAGKPVKLADLKKDDRVVVHHMGDEKGRIATELEAQRVVEEKGVVRDVDLKKNMLTMSIGETDVIRPAIPFAAKCEITLNNQAKLEERLLKPADLKPGDKVTIAHDTAVVRVDAYRVLGQSGVIQKVQFAARTIDVLHEGDTSPATYIIGPKCKITLGDDSVELADLRDGDTVEITHDRPDAKTPEALTVAAKRPADPNRWAILIGTQDYEDQSLGKLDHAVGDAKLLAEMLMKRYKVPAEQAVVLADENLVRLEQSIPDRLSKIGPDGSLIVYFAGHAYKDDKGVVYLALKNFDAKRPAEMGKPLQWLVDQMEQCPAKEKLLLLDCSQAGPDADAAHEPSTAEMIRSLKAPPGRSPLRTMTAVASCKAGERGQPWPSKGHGLFAACLADAYSGHADTNQDGRIEPTELFGFLQGAMSTAAAEVKAAQTPELFLPDNRPPRLTEEAKNAIRKLAASLGQTKIDLAVANQEYASAAQLAGKEPEPRMLYGLLLMRAKEPEGALKHMEELKSEKPNMLLPMQSMAWLRFQKHNCAAGVGELVDLVNKLPKPDKPGEPCSPQAQQILTWAGQLREYAASAEQETHRPGLEPLAALDAAVADRGAEAKSFYQAGRDHSAAIVDKYDKQLTGSEDSAVAARVKVERRQLVHYAAFPFETYSQQVLDGLDKE